jgi:hypothetical protein
MISYYVTPQVTVGMGGRYWALWTNNGHASRTVDNGFPIPETPPQAFKAFAEQAGLFMQAAYHFGPDCF